MTLHALIDTTTPGPVIRRRLFADGEDTTLAPEKGRRWIPDTPPPFDAQTQTRTEAASVPVDAAAVPYAVADIPPAALRAARQAALAALRFGYETGGVTVNGLTIATDRESQMLIGETERALSDGVIASVKFKAAGGAIVNCDAATGAALRSAVVLHVQACRNNEAALSAALDEAETAADILAVDLAAGWPA